MGSLLSKEIYNAIPVYYCKLCLSLRIKSLPLSNNVDFCDDCNSTDINQVDIYTWQEMYKLKYGEYYLNLNKDGRE